MSIAVDIGNTTIKIGYFSNGQLTHTQRTQNDLADWDILLSAGRGGVIVSATGKIPEQLENMVKNKGMLYHQLSYRSVLPVAIEYKTPETLGQDRISAAVGANVIFPEQTTLIIDIGTAVTFDLVDASTFKGGNISPGLKLRYTSLYQQTAKLPMVGIPKEHKLYGETTVEAMENGVFNGLLYEIESTIQHFDNLYTKLNTILTGGDAHFFVNKIKKTIFVEPNLVLIGLNNILKHNV